MGVASKKLYLNMGTIIHIYTVYYVFSKHIPCTDKKILFILFRMTYNQSHLMSIVLVLVVALHAVLGQNYHFSNGWHPGKRSFNYQSCQFSNRVKTVIFNMLRVRKTSL